LNRATNARLNTNAGLKSGKGQFAAKKFSGFDTKQLRVFERKMGLICYRPTGERRKF
jgi:hypothetical protein